MSEGGVILKLSDPPFLDVHSWTRFNMQLRCSVQVAEYVKERVLALRRENPGLYENVACTRTNAMKFMPHYFRKVRRRMQKNAG